MRAPLRSSVLALLAESRELAILAVAVLAVVGGIYGGVFALVMGLPRLSPLQAVAVVAAVLVACWLVIDAIRQSRELADLEAYRANRGHGPRRWRA